MRAPELIDKKAYPSVWKFMAEFVEMQFADLRVMLQEPRDPMGLGPGCNFAAAAVLLNLISGFSVCLYNASLEVLSDPRRRGERFRKLLECYYPWDGEQYSPAKGSNWLWRGARNPLVHSLGVQISPTNEWTVIAKKPLSSSDISNLESSSKRPVWLGDLGFTIFQIPAPPFAKKVFLSVPCLYWGVWRMSEKLCKDSDQMKKADKLLSDLY